MRSVILAVSLLSIGAWLFVRTTRQDVQTQPSQGNTTTPGPTSQPEQSNLDYLNFDFWSILSGDSNMKNADPYKKEQGNPVPRGIGNNNPLNIEANSIEWRGKIGSDGRFIVFDTVHNGIRAAARILKTYRDKYRLNTVAGVVNRWAPPIENPTDKYIAFVANKAGVTVNQVLSADDYPNVIAAMIHFENGYNPYEQSTIQAATADGMA
ncbi:hypothetical protein EXU30_00090 [Shewanella maritima]|uniref:Structural protein P5 n=1 Tax=Shewanella maritima TaxID=2520507 RepID=A0A411PCM6_9GAMM|nr:hypothetical protein [Shewanella maritima]QBF81268.1 hypothetical protein EXU30_00090 [Shewanella maritima]